MLRRVRHGASLALTGCGIGANMRFASCVTGRLAIGALFLAQGVVVSFQSATSESVGLVGGSRSYVIEANDTLAALAARHGVDVATLARQNGLEPATLLQRGSTLRIDNRHIVPDSAHVPIVINVPQRMLFRRRDDGTVRGYPIAAGQSNWQTPLGAFSIVAKRKDPVWNVPVSIQEEMRLAGKAPIAHVPPGPANPLGDRWLGTSLQNVGIHGTNAPLSIYRLETHGCIRLHPDDARELFDGVALETPGEILYQPVLMRQFGDRVLLEVHPDVYERAVDPGVIIRRMAIQAGFEAVVDWQAAASVARQRAGIAIDVTRSSR